MKNEITFENWTEFCKNYRNNPELEIPNEIIVEKTLKIYNNLTSKIKESGKSKIVISIYGGSGVGKTTVTKLLSYVFHENGINNFVLSGDDYPRRIPLQNDNERMRIYREHGLKGLVSSKEYTEDCMHILKDLLGQDLDFDPIMIEKHNWLATYQKQGREYLGRYLGTNEEIDFEEISKVLEDFKKGQKEIYIKSLGREENKAFYYKEDFSEVEVLILEWTHGNSEFLKGVDIPVFLVSTPEETLEWRKIRNKDTGIGNPFTTQVLEIEQSKLNNQAKSAKLIVSLMGEFLSFEEFCKLY